MRDRSGSGNMGGVVTEHLIGLIRAAVDRHGIAVWFDPERQYEAVATALSLPETAVHRYEGSFLALRRAIDPLLNDLTRDSPPRLAVYVPLAEEGTADALVELTAAGAVLQPGHPVAGRNTRLAVVARGALARLCPPETLQALITQVEAGKLTLPDLDEWAARGGEAQAAAVQALYGTANALDVALSFLTDTGQDEAVRERRIEQDLLGLLEMAFDVALPRDGGLAAARERLARHLLLTDLLCRLPGEPPSALQSVHLPQTPAARQAAVRLAQQWRHLRPHRDGYRAHAERVERELGLAALPWTLAQLAATETFPSLEGRLQAAVEEALTARAAPELVELAERRLASFWSEAEPEVQARWALVAVAGRLLLETEHAAAELKSAPREPAALIHRYTGVLVSSDAILHKDSSPTPDTLYRPHPNPLPTGEGASEEGWCVLDTLHRHLEQRVLAFDFDVHGAHDSLRKLVGRARQRYDAVANDLAERFVAALERAKFAVDGVPAQLEVFKRVVAAALQEGKVAYVLVELGVARIVVTADHGFVFGDELGSDMKIDPPGGHTVDLHRRVWVGHGGEASPSYLRVPASQLGWGGDLEVAVPRSLAGFKVGGGARAYFHGGLSLQECVVPVLSIRVAAPKPEVHADEEWALTPGSAKIATRFLSVQVSCRAVGLLKLRPRRVRVEVRVKGQAKPVSMPVAASYGFEDATGAVQLRLAEAEGRTLEPNTVTLMLVEEVTGAVASVHLLDADSSVELQRLEEIEVAIAKGYS